MTCKDCINFDFCKKQDDLACSIIADYFSNIADHEIDEDGAEECPVFKDRNKFIELPCKIGDTAYYITTACDCCEFQLSESDIADEECGCHKRCGTQICKPISFTTKYIDEIGKTVFSAKEEAEKMLNERYCK